jgi:hypothetical protein
MDSRTAHQVFTWATLNTGDDGTLVMLVGDLPRPMRFAGDPTTAAATSDTFGGAWFGARWDGVPVLAFGLVELDDAAGAIAAWCVADPPPSLIDAALDVPHVVAVIPSDVAGVEAFGRDAEASVALLAYATMVEASHQAPSLLTLAESYDRDEPAADPVLGDLEDLDAVRAALAPVRSRVALATGELLTDNQALPMAWRPWHYNLIEEEHTGGLQWQWPVIQIFFGLAEPTVHSLDGIGSPSPEQRRMLENYLAIARRLAGRQQRGFDQGQFAPCARQWSRRGRRSACRRARRLAAYPAPARRSTGGLGDVVQPRAQRTVGCRAHRRAHGARSRVEALEESASAPPAQPPG